MTMQVFKNLLIPVFAMIGLCANATELIYAPTNPTFGGNPLNGPYLLGKAQSQNDHTDDKSGQSRNSQLTQFQEALQRNVLNQIAREVAGLAFGEEGLTEGGVFETDQFSIEVITTNPDSVGVRITNTQTGEVTMIEVPVFN